MPVADEREVEVIVDRLRHAVRRKDAAAQSSAHGRCHLHVTQCRHVKIRACRTNDSLEPLAEIRPKDELHDGGRVDDDDPQKASRSARSSRTRSAARAGRLALVLLATRSNTSSAGGLATSRSRISWM